MSGSQKTVIIKFLIAFLILALFLSVKNIVLINLESLGLSESDSLSFRLTWNSFKLDYAFIIFSLIVSFLISLKYNIKGDI